MERTFFVKIHDPTFVEPQGAQVVAFIGHNDDVELHQFTQRHLAGQEATAIILAFPPEEKETALALALHIRLMPREAGVHLLPIMLLSTATLPAMLAVGSKGSILCTPGIYFLFNPDTDTVVAHLASAVALEQDAYEQKFLKVVVVERGDLGNHSLANVWGVKVLAEACRITLENTRYAEIESRLYFKLVGARKQTRDDLGKVSASRLEKFKECAAGKKILYIDDEADKGWDEVLKQLFGQNDGTGVALDIVSKSGRNDAEFHREIEEKITGPHYQLYLVDLRLLGSVEEGVVNTQDMSGMKILRRLKNINRGFQVMMFTASNKAWNLNELLAAGADGYYIKPSPEDPLTEGLISLQTESFLKAVEQCFTRSYLADLFDYHTSWRARIDRILTHDDDQIFKTRMSTALDVAFALLYSSRQFLQQINLAYLTYFGVIEDYAAHSLSKKERHENGKGEPKYLKLFLEKMHAVAERANPDETDFETPIHYDNNSKAYKVGVGNVHEDYVLKTRFLISALLVSARGKGDEELVSWKNLTNIRNKRAAHGLNGQVTVDVILQLCDMIDTVLPR